MFEVDGVCYVPVNPSERTCDAIDCRHNETVANVTIASTVSYKGITMHVNKVQPYFCYGNPFVQTLNCDYESIISNYAFSGCTNLSSLTLGEKVSSIGDYSFQGCSSLSSVSIPNSVSTLGYSAFSGCSSLASVSIGNNVKSLGNNVFQDCGILAISIPASVNSISDYAFGGCTKLKTVIIANRDNELSLGCNGSSPLFSDSPIDSVYIGGNISYNTSPFYRNTSLRTVVITDKETEISPNEFYGCTNLQNFTIGDGVTSFGDWAFSGCTSLKRLSFGSHLTSIGKEAFSDCSSVTQIISKAVTPPSCGTQALDDINKWECTLQVPQGHIAAYQQADQWKEFFFIEEFETIRATDISLNQTSLSFNAINQTTTLIATVSPSNATSKEVLWTSSNPSVATVNDAGVVTSKAYGTAIITVKTTDGTNLTATCFITVVDENTIIFADANVKAICVARWDTNKDGELNYDEAAAVKYLGETSFKNSDITLFNELQYFTGLTSITSHAFSGCSGLTSIIIPNSVTSIGYYAFSGCSGLASITIPNSVTSIGAWAFMNCNGLTSVTIPNSVTSIGGGAFSGCSSLTSVTIPNSVTSIGSSAFGVCSGLTSIVVESGNTVYDSRNNCNAIIETASNTLIVGCQNAIIPNSVTSIGNSAFYGCSSLTSITIPNSVTSIGNYAFEGCSGLTSITIPNSVTSIGNSAFEGCSGLTSIIIPNSVTSIGKYAFEDCTSLTSITIGNSVTSIGEDAFWGCIGLTDVYCLADNVPETGNYVFNRCPVASATLYVPGSAIDNYSTTSPWSEFGTILPMTQDMIDGIDCPKASEANGDDNTETARYDGQGNRLSSPQKGLNIIRYSDGSTRKVMVK